MSLKNKSTPEWREFWAFVEKTAREVDSWPAWKRGESMYSTDSNENVVHYTGSTVMGAEIAALKARVAKLEADRDSRIADHRGLLERCGQLERIIAAGQAEYSAAREEIERLEARVLDPETLDALIRMAGYAINWVEDLAETSSFEGDRRNWRDLLAKFAAARAKLEAIRDAGK